ncbi:MAG: hypothetical protein HUU41_00010 [Bryobacteraceae bacterium]|nr:hypothetical protein [Bryobacterales bacterium]NUM99468.1 hypothetical protein [Bryobacteraceae bacterium]
MNHGLIFLLAAALINGAAGAESAAMRGPVSGYVFDSESGSVRPVLGMPGSSTVGDPLPSETAIGRATISTEQDFAIVLAGESRTPAVLNLGDPLGKPVMIQGLAPGDYSIALSPSGKAVALLEAESGAIHIVERIASAPGADAAIRVPGASSPSRLAISDDGARLLVVTRDGDSDVLTLLDNGGNVLSSTRLGDVAAAEFLFDSHDALVADRARRELLLAGAAGIRLLLDSSVLVEPVAVAASRHNRRAVVADAKSQAVVSVGLDGEGVLVTACPCEISGLQRFQGDAVFLLTSTSSKPMWVFDGDATSPRVVFVPVAE